MRKLLILFGIVLMIGGCDKIGGPKAGFTKVVNDLGELRSTLQQHEITMNDYLLMKNLPDQGCRAALGLDALKERVKLVRAGIDALKPADMPTKENTTQVGIDPNTKQPILETDVVVDWGKVSGDTQKLWANINTAEYGVSTGVDMLSIGCKCIDGRDRKSADCTMVGFQFVNGKFSLELGSIESMYLKTSREILERM